MSSNLWVPDAFLRRLCEEFYIGEFHHCSDFCVLSIPQSPRAKAFSLNLMRKLHHHQVEGYRVPFIVFTLRQLDIELHLIFVEESIDNSKKKKRKKKILPFISLEKVVIAPIKVAQSRWLDVSSIAVVCTKSQLQEESVETKPEVLLWNDASCKSIPSWHTVLLELS